MIKLVSEESDKIFRRYDQKCVLRAGENGRHRETTLKRFPEFFFGWTRKVFTSLDQRNLVCLNRITDNRSTACPIPLKTAENGTNCHNVHFRQKWIDCRSVIVYLI